MLNEKITINGIWFLTTFKLPYIANNKTEYKDMTIKVFGTSNSSINEEINYLGVSPCPESL